MHACMPSCFSCVQLFATLWTVTWQTSLSMGFSRREYWSGLPCSPPGHLPNPGIEPLSPALQMDSLPTYAQSTRLNVETYLSSFFFLLEPTFLKETDSSIPPGWLAHHQSKQNFQNIPHFLNLSHCFRAVKPNPCIELLYFQISAKIISIPCSGSCFLDLIIFTSSDKSFHLLAVLLCKRRLLFQGGK